MQHAQRRPARCGQVDDVPEPAHVLELQVPRIIEINVGLQDAADQQHPGAGPVQVAEQLDPAVRTGLAEAGRRPGGCGLARAPGR